MGHDELLARIKLYELEVWTGVPEDRDELATALRAVVELHKPTHHAVFVSDLECKICDEPYPCPTIQAIEKELF